MTTTLIPTLHPLAGSIRCLANGRTVLIGDTGKAIFVDPEDCDFDDNGYDPDAAYERFLEDAGSRFDPEGYEREDREFSEDLARRGVCEAHEGVTVQRTYSGGCPVCERPEGMTEAEAIREVAGR